MNFILRETQPMMITINGVEYPAIWNFKAIATMEDYSSLMHLLSIARIKAGNPEYKDIVGALYGMLSAAGVTYTDASGKDNLPEAIIKSLNPADELDLIKQINKVISAQGDQPAEGGPKNAPKPRKKI